MRDRRIRWLGWGIIGLLWLTCAYLVIYYGALYIIGVDRLHALLGERAYDALIPAGGFPSLVAYGVLAACWVVPFGLTFLITRAATLNRHRWLPWVAAAAITTALPLTMFDGWPWALLPAVFPADTEFASGYTVFGYLAVRPGMTPAEVVSRLGEPLERRDGVRPGETIWRWTRSAEGGSYRVRALVMRDGVVAEKVSEFYVD